MIKAKIDRNGWCHCAACWHKMFFVTDWGVGTGGHVRLEIKCHSCKTVNEITLYT